MKRVFKKAFVDELDALYPESKDMHRLMNEDNPWLGRWLYDSACADISYTDVLEAKSLEELQERARLIKRKWELYDWYMSKTCYEDISD